MAKSWRCMLAVKTREERLSRLDIRCKAVLSNANVRNTIQSLVGEAQFDPVFVEEVKSVRNNTELLSSLHGDQAGRDDPKHW